MKNEERDKYESNARRYLETVGERFAFDDSIGIYQHKPAVGAPERQEHPESHTNRNSPFPVIVRRDRLAFAVSALTLLLLGCTVFFAKRQWEAMDKTFGQVKRQADDAGCAVIAAQDGVKTAGRQMRVGERPWLKFRFGDAGSGDSESVTIQISANNPISIPSQFLNFGKTPARDVHGMAILQVVDVGKDPDVPGPKQGISGPDIGEPTPKGSHFIKSLTGGQEFEESVIYPGSHSQFSVNRTKPSKKRGFVEALPLSAPEYAALTAKSAYIAVWGQVWYDDIFGVAHWAKFCSTKGVGFDPASEKCVKYADVDANMDPPSEAKESPNKINCPVTASP